MITREQRINAQAHLVLKRADEGDEASPRQLVGHAATTGEFYDIGGFGREKIAPGAFKERLEDDVRALFNHDTNFVLGRTTAGTLELEEDDTGLLTRTEIADAAWVREMVVGPIERRDITQMSFAFSVDWDEDVDFEEDEESGLLFWTINRFTKLWDISPVTFPANEGTSISARAAERVEAEALAAAARRGAIDPIGLRRRRLDLALL